MVEIPENLSLNELVELQTDIRRRLRVVYAWFDAQRPNWDEYFSLMALVVASRGSCARRRVGCILVSKDHQTLSTGYNGKAAGLENCLESPCTGAYRPAGKSLDDCEAIHAEINALIRCPDTNKVETVYVTCSPCVPCVNALLGTSATRIVFTQDYGHSEESKRRWLKAGREWVHLIVDNPKTQ